MAGAMGKFGYISDDGTTYKVRLDASNATAGGFSAATTEPSLPGGYHMRYVWVESSGGVRRKIQVGDPASGLWTGSTATVALPVEGSAGTTTFNVRGHIGERRFAI